MSQAFNDFLTLRSRTFSELFTRAFPRVELSVQATDVSRETTAMQITADRLPSGHIRVTVEDDAGGRAVMDLSPKAADDLARRIIAMAEVRPDDREHFPQRPEFPEWRRR